MVAARACGAEPSGPASTAPAAATVTSPRTGNPPRIRRPPCSPASRSRWTSAGLRRRRSAPRRDRWRPRRERPGRLYGAGRRGRVEKQGEPKGSSPECLKAWKAQMINGSPPQRNYAKVRKAPWPRPCASGRMVAALTHVAEVKRKAGPLVKSGPAFRRPFSGPSAGPHRVQPLRFQRGLSSRRPKEPVLVPEPRWSSRRPVGRSPPPERKPPEGRSSRRSRLNGRSLPPER